MCPEGGATGQQLLLVNKIKQEVLVTLPRRVIPGCKFLWPTEEEEAQIRKEMATANARVKAQQRLLEAEQNAETAFWECIKKSESKE